MIENRPMLAAGVPFDLERHAYLRAIYLDMTPEQILCKAAQMGASEYLISWALHAADDRAANVLYVFPTDTHMSQFSASRLGPAIEREVSPYLADIIVPGGMSRSRHLSHSHQRGVDRVTLKRVRNRFVYFRGGQVKPDGRANQLKSISADCVALDEFDEMDRRAPEIARKRLEHSPLKEVRSVSTPTYKSQGIWQEYLRSDCRHWFVKCSRCNERQHLTLDHLILEQDKLGRPLKWNERNGEPVLCCQKCGAVLDCFGPGEWVPEFPSRSIHGYHMVGFMSPHKSLRELLGLDRENSGLNSTDETTRKETYNQGVGLPYTSTGATSLSIDQIDACRRDYSFSKVMVEDDNPKQRCMSVAGIDVGRMLHIIIRAKKKNGDWPLMFAGQVESFEDAARVLKEHGVRIAVIDGLPETRKSRELQGAFPKDVIWLAYYGSPTAEVTKQPLEVKWDVKDRKVDADRTRTLDQTFGRFVAASQGEPGNSLPANARDIRDYYSQLKAPERTLENDAKGNQRAVYIESDADHFAHAENYCYMASACPIALSWSRGMG